MSATALARDHPGTSSPAIAPLPGPIGRLGDVCARHCVAGLAGRLAELESWIAEDLRGVEAELSRLPRHDSVVEACAHHLLDGGGKRLRPTCVLLAARLGDGGGKTARDLAVAVELIHNASLLHDDVIDLGDERRGSPAARAVYGNAASIIAGNWLLVTALGRLSASRLPGIVGRTLATIGEMIAAEAVQLEQRGRLNGSKTDYFRVVQGKTAALFRWALLNGGLAGGLPRRSCEALGRYGTDLGVAFQLIDDVLDYTGEVDLTGKPLFADLREGRMTYPLLLGLERDPSLRPLLRRIVEVPAGTSPPDDTAVRVRRKLLACDAIRDCRALARDRTEAAMASLAGIDGGPGRWALEMLARAVVRRSA